MRQQGPKIIVFSFSSSLTLCIYIHASIKQEYRNKSSDFLSYFGPRQVQCVWCSCSSRFRCVEQIVTFLYTFCSITAVKTSHRFSLQNSLPQFLILTWDSFSFSCVEAERDYSRLQSDLFLSCQLTARFRFCRIIRILEIGHFRRTT